MVIHVNWSSYSPPVPVLGLGSWKTKTGLASPPPSRVAASEWWEGLVKQYRGEGVEFGALPLAPQARLPRSLFDNVADNLVRNALAKRAMEDNITVRVALQCADFVLLRVCDSGSAIAEDLASQLLRAPVGSTSGLGIGLYQAAQLARASGYVLALEDNRDGAVCFVLSGPAR